MDTYVVIHVKKRDEKVKILNFLAAETDSEFKVTADLKEFVAEKYNVKITDYVEMKDQATDMRQEKAIDIITVKDEVVNNIVDVVPVVGTPTIDNNLDTLYGQHTDIADTQRSDNVAAQGLLHVENQQELFNIGTYVPYRDRMIEPKEERIDEMVGDDEWLMEMEREQEVMEGQEGGDIGLLMGIDGDGIVKDDMDNESVDNTTINKDIPTTSLRRRRPEKKKVDDPSSSRRLGRTTKRPRYSMDDDKEEGAIRKEDATSTTRRSGRVTKQSKYSMDDDSDDDSEHVLEAKKKENTSPKPQEAKKKDDCCQKCGAEKQGYLHRVEHVLSHAKMTKYECMADGCGYKAAYKGDVRRHSKMQHDKTSNNYREVQFTREQTEEFDKIMKECFPVTEKDNENICQVCHQSVGGNSRSSFTSKKDHALHHIDIMLYKCMEDGCQFESKTHRLMKSHSNTHGPTSKKSLTKIELTKEQKLEIKKLFVKCFPGFG